MKKQFFAIISLFIIGVVGIACSDETKMPKFPYQGYLDALEVDSFAEITDNDFGYNPIGPHVRYLELPDKLAGNALADSLLQFYNTALAYNAFVYDVGTAERYLYEDSTNVEFANAFESFNLSGVKNERFNKLLQSSARIIAEVLRKGESPMDSPNADFEIFMSEFDAYTTDLFMPRFTYEEFDPYYEIDNYYEFHDKAITDSLHFRGELLQMVLNEKDFTHQCIYACEYAYSNYASEEKNYEDVIAVFDMLLRANKYSPMLRDMWRIWRVTLQKDLLAGMSNDSPMYNLFYNDMRNRVALTLIEYMASNPDDFVAFMEFVKLGLAENINRHSGVLVGSNVLKEDMELLYNHTQ